MKPILTYPDNRLRTISEPVSIFDEALQNSMLELKAAMDSGPGGVGIAAPQIGWLQRIVIVDCSKALRPCKHHGLLFMINPVVHDCEGESLGREGCLSVPEWVGMVPRAKRIEVSFLDGYGQVHRIEAQGFEARVIQHEVDHLDGVLFIDKVISTHDLIRRIETRPKE